MTSGALRSTVEDQIGDHLSARHFRDLPGPVVEQAKRAIMWWTATALEGSVEAEQTRFRSYLSQQGGRAEATVLGSAHRLPAEAAGLINGRAGKAFEHEDKFWAGEAIGVAIGCCVVPAAVAVAQALGGVSGAELITAVALAIDLEARLVRPIDPPFFYGRVATNATFALGNYGAALAASKILAFDRDRVMNALGIVHGQAAGYLQGQLEGRGVAQQCGFAVRNGIAAARLAANGVEGPRSALTGRAGLYEALFPGSKVDLDSLVDQLGLEYLGVDLAFKAYPCGIVVHPALDAVRSLRSRLGGREVEAIQIAGPTSLRIMAEPIALKRIPNTAVEAQFSAPWVVACVLRDDTLSVDHYSPASLADSGLLDIAARVTLDLDDSHAGSRVRISLRDGSILQSERIRIPRGHPANPIPTRDISELFTISARRAAIEHARGCEALARLEDLEHEVDVDATYSLLNGSLS